MQQQFSKLLYVSPEQYFKTLKTSEWVKNVSLGQVFTPRTGHECILADGMIYLFGGTDDEERLNDIFAYNIRANSWDKITQASTTKNPVPEARSGARGVAYMDGLYFFGGYQRKQGTYFNDLFYFDLDKRVWNTITTISNSQNSSKVPPSPRTDHTAVLYEGSMYVFGGYDGRARFNDLYKCKLRKGKYSWKQIEAEGTIPLNRFGHAAVVCRNSMFVIGGWNGHDTMDDVF